MDEKSLSDVRIMNTVFPLTSCIDRCDRLGDKNAIYSYTKACNFSHLHLPIWQLKQTSNATIMEYNPVQNSSLTPQSFQPLSHSPSFQNNPFPPTPTIMDETIDGAKMSYAPEWTSALLDYGPPDDAACGVSACSLWASTRATLASIIFTAFL